MALSQLQTKRSDGIGFIDQRSGLYYNKFKYRARFYCKGVTLAWFKRRLDETLAKITEYQNRFKGADANHIFAFYQWKEVAKKNKTATVRIEGDVASIFSNDLALLKTLESIGCPVDYTEVDEAIIVGVKFFVKEPKYKYRLYLKSKRVTEEFRTKLLNFINRYENTDTVIVPSGSLKRWLSDDSRYAPSSWSYGWNRTYSSSSHFIDYNDESTVTLFSIMFSGMISKTYKLEKRPDPV